MSKLARDHRNRELAQIHIAKAQLASLFPTDDDYRQMLFTVARVRSAKDLDYAGRKKVIEHLVKLGFNPAAPKSSKRPPRPTPAADKIKLVKRIRAQLISLDRLPDTYADGVAKQMFGVDRYEWCTHDQLHAITAALAVKQRKEGAATQ